MALVPILPSRVSFEVGISLKKGYTLSLDSCQDDEVDSVNLALVVKDADGADVLELDDFYSIGVDRIEPGPHPTSPLSVMREERCSFSEALDRWLGGLIVANVQLEIRFNAKAEDVPASVTFRIRTETGYDDSAKEDWEDCEDFIFHR